MRRPLCDVLSTGALAGAYAGLATGAIDAIWSWAPASQFAHGFVGRLRFVAYNTVAYGAAGLVLDVPIYAIDAGPPAASDAPAEEAQARATGQRARWCTRRRRRALTVTCRSARKSATPIRTANAQHRGAATGSVVVSGRAPAWT